MNVYKKRFPFKEIFKKKIGPYIVLKSSVARAAGEYFESSS